MNVEDKFSELIKFRNHFQNELRRFDRELYVLKTAYNLDMKLPDETSRIKLDVGGRIYSTTLATLKSVQNSYFDVILSDKWSLLLESDGTIFIDRNPFVFEYILNYLRGISIDFISLNSKQLIALAEDANYYQLEEFMTMIKKFRINTFIFEDRYINELFNLFPNVKQFKLLYRGSRDGFTASRFHEMCDGIDDTLVVVQDSNGCVFGGYSPKCWDQSGYEKYDPKTFLFYAQNNTLNKLYHLKLEKFDEISKKKVLNCEELHSIYCDKKFGPFFGCVDLCIYDKCNENMLSHVDTKHFEKPSTSSGYLCDKNKFFKVYEIEIFELVK